MIGCVGDPIVPQGSIEIESALFAEVPHGLYMHAEGKEKKSMLIYPKLQIHARKNRLRNNAAQYTTM